MSLGYCTRTAVITLEKYEPIINCTKIVLSVVASWTPPGARRGRNGGQDAGGGGPRRVARVCQDVGRPESPTASPGGAYKAKTIT